LPRLGGSARAPGRLRRWRPRSRPGAPILRHHAVRPGIPAPRKFTATAGAQTITLERLAQPGPHGYLLAQISIGGSATHFYTVEARRRIGFDAGLPGDAIIIHEVDMEREAPAMLMGRPGEDVRLHADSMWQVGQTFVNATHGVTITVEAETATGFVVTIALR
ncbi:MAG: hypothetical protein WHX53_06945, partial [Anaerolineae bacterium]